jgi:hypothetical protein
MRARLMSSCGSGISEENGFPKRGFDYFGPVQCVALRAPTAREGCAGLGLWP